MPAYRKSSMDLDKIPRRDDKAKWAYLAGLIDAYGTIFIGFYPERNSRSVVIQIGATKTALIEYLQETFNGNVGKSKITTAGKSFRIWSINGSRNCKPFLIRLRPYLVAKKQQAETALEFIDTFTVDHPRYKSRPGFKRIYIKKNHELWQERENERLSLSLHNKVLNAGGVLYA